MIYTGERKKKPEYILLSEAFFEESVPDLEVRVKVIYNSREGDILSQYIAFTKVYNEQMKMYGRTREAVAETIRICKDREILKEYLECHEREVADAMMTLFDQEEILRIYVEEKQKEAVKEVETKAAEATKIAKKEAELKSAAELLKSGKLTAEELPQFFSSLTESDINKIKENLQKDKEEE